jgi:hypothetical protein
MMGTDANETFGTFYTDYTGNPGTTWGYVSRTGPGTQAYNATANYVDTLGVSGPANAIPVPQCCGGGNTLVWHDLPWNYWVFSQAYGSGVSIHSDSQQYYQDHGTHSAP